MCCLFVMAKSKKNRRQKFEKKSVLRRGGGRKQNVILYPECGDILKQLEIENTLTEKTIE
jgi:transcriptional regulator of NAD metabolism